MKKHTMLILTGCLIAGLLGNATLHVRAAPIPPQSNLSAPIIADHTTIQLVRQDLISDEDINQTKEVWESLGQPVIISPDFAGEQAKTIEAYNMCCQKYGVDNVIGALQGASYREVLGCLNYYKGQIAVPFNIGSADDTPNSLMAIRRALIVSNIPADRYIHLLGFSTLDEFEWYETKPNVLSINTGYPVMLGMKSEDILDIGKECDKSENTLEMMEKVEAENKEMSQTQWTAIIRNIALLRRYIS